MSWLARSIANSLKLDAEDDNLSVEHSNPDQTQVQKHSPTTNATDQTGDSPPASPSRGVKEDISELTKTLTRQLWGVASFLAPPPQSDPESPQVPDPNSPHEKSVLNPDGSDQVSVAGIRSDFAEIGGKFRSGISKLSNNIAVSEFTKMASNFLQLGSDDEEELGREGKNLGMGAIGVTEEVVAFARDISMHPGTWLDFPLPENEEDGDFDLSDAQQEHALAVEHLAPMLAALRMELCPGYMSESRFWKIYFVLLHPQLDKEDAALLLTPQVLEARALLSQELPSRTMAKVPGSSETAGVDTKASLEPVNIQPQTGAENMRATSVKLESSHPADHSETEKYPVASTEVKIVDKSVIEEKHVDQIKDASLSSLSSNLLVDNTEDDYDDWLKEESSEVGAASGATIAVENEEDVSFSDLEEDEGDAPASFKGASQSSSNKDARDWVQLSKSSGDSSKKVISSDTETKESIDWLDVDIDVA